MTLSSAIAMQVCLAHCMQKDVAQQPNTSLHVILWAILLPRLAPRSG
jgi:hypothetical protein